MEQALTTVNKGTGEIIEVMIAPDQVELIKRTVAQGATGDELELYFYDCKRQGVHPLDKLIHFTKRKGKYTPITSIDFMRMRAAETGEFAGCDEPVFTGQPGQADFKATVTVYRIVKGLRCAFVGVARWDEFYPGDGDQGFMWRKMKHNQLAKCAEAQGLRKGFPKQLAGLYAKEEMDQAGPTETAAERPAIRPPQPKTTVEEVKEEISDEEFNRLADQSLAEDAAARQKKDARKCPCGDELSQKNIEYYNSHPDMERLCFACSTRKKKKEPYGANRPKKAASDFLSSMADMRTKLGDKEFFLILGRHGVESPEEITDRKKQIEIFKEMSTKEAA